MVAVNTQGSQGGMLNLPQGHPASTVLTYMLDAPAGKRCLVSALDGLPWYEHCKDISFILLEQWPLNEICRLHLLLGERSNTAGNNAKLHVTYYRHSLIPKWLFLEEVEKFFDYIQLPPCSLT